MITLFNVKYSELGYLESHGKRQIKAKFKVIFRIIMHRNHKNIYSK